MRIRSAISVNKEATGEKSMKCTGQNPLFTGKSVFKLIAAAPLTRGWKERSRIRNLILLQRSFAGIGEIYRSPTLSIRATRDKSGLGEADKNIMTISLSKLFSFSFSTNLKHSPPSSTSIKIASGRLSRVCFETYSPKVAISFWVSTLNDVEVAEGDQEERLLRHR